MGSARLDVQNGGDVFGEQSAAIEGEYGEPMMEEAPFHRPSRPLFQHRNGTDVRFHSASQGDLHGAASVRHVSYSNHGAEWADDRLK